MKLLIISLILATSAPWGCSGPREVERKEEPPISSGDFLRRYEKTFNPAEYDSDIKLVKEEEKTRRSVPEAAYVATTAVPETIPGFRVQILLTQDIDEAVRIRDSVESLLPEEWSYIVYDSPYYKIRLGNYEDRSSAHPLLKRVTSLGFKSAWIVPDNVVKNLPPKPPDTSIEPGKPFENHR